MSDTHSTDQSRDRVVVKHIADHSVGLALVKSALRPAGDDPARILPAMLQQSETFANFWRCINGRIVQ